MAIHSRGSVATYIYIIYIYIYISARATEEMSELKLMFAAEQSHFF